MPDKTNVLPNNLEAEQSLLGCILIDNEVLSEVVDKLSDEDFYQESHRLIMSAILKVFNQRKPTDLVTITDSLEKDGNLEKAGGIEYITRLMEIPSAANYRSYFDIVKRDSVNRELIRASRRIIENSMSSGDGMQSVQYAEKLIYDISKKGDSSTMDDIRESTVVNDVIDRSRPSRATKMPCAASPRDSRSSINLLTASSGPTSSSSQHAPAAARLRLR